MRFPEASLHHPTATAPAATRADAAAAPASRVSINASAFTIVLALVLGVGCCKNTKPAALPNAETESTAQAVQTATATPAGSAPTTKQACDACSGKWGKHGIADQESCICKTKDGGKACRDGDECTGQCLATDEAAFEVTVKGPPAKGYWRGQCSEYDTTFGCHRTIPAGAKARPPLSKEDAADNICID
jgi:hypothetical protein